MDLERNFIRNISFDKIATTTVFAAFVELFYKKQKNRKWKFYCINNLSHK